MESQQIELGSPEEELTRLEHLLLQLKIEYERYFLGQRAREPLESRAELERKIARKRRTPIRNTAVRFRFNALESRLQVYQRRWNKTLREIEAGTYSRQIFKDRLSRKPSCDSTPATQPHAGLFEDYRRAAISCGQSLHGLTPDRLQKALVHQQEKLRERFGAHEVEFCVVVREGRVKLSARRRRN